MHGNHRSRDESAGLGDPLGINRKVAEGVTDFSGGVIEGCIGNKAAANIYDGRKGVPTFGRNHRLGLSTELNSGRELLGFGT